MIGLVPLLASQNARSGQAYKATVLADNPVGYWRLGEKTGTSAADASGNGNTGTYAGGVTLGLPGAIQADPDGLVNTAALFDGSSGYVNTGATVAVGEKLAVEAWASSTGATWSANSCLVVSRGANGFILHPDIGGRSWTVYVYDSGGTFHNLGAHTPADIQGWHHYAFTYDGANGAYARYFDGAVVGSGTNAFTRTSATRAIFVGKDSDSPLFLAGKVDEVAVYPTALSAARIAAHYAAAA